MSIRTLSSNLRKSSGGFSLLEVMIASTLFAVGIGITMTVFLYSTRTFAMMANFASLDQANRVALDKMTKELRGAQAITEYSGTSISLVNCSNQAVTYAFEPNNRQLVRTVNAGAPQVLLTNCDLLTFTVGQRNATNNSFDFYPAPGTNTIKEVNFRWQAEATIPGTQNVVSEDMQSAQIVLRVAGTGAQ